MPASPRGAADRLFAPAVFALAAAPAVWLAWLFLTDGLGANPLDEITDWTGRWTLRMLVATLAVTPLRRLTGWNRLQKVRRMLGLFAFFWVVLHLTTYVWLDKFFAWGEILADVGKRRFITAGATGFLVLAALAATSTGGMVRRLGAERWQRLHRLVYVGAAAGVVHYLWLVKADRTRPLAYAAVLTLLLALRIPWIAERLPRLRGALNSRRRGVMSPRDAGGREANLPRDPQEA